MAATRAGTARYLAGLLPSLERLVDVERLAWGGGGRVTAAVRDAWWYPVELPRRARNVDVLHCPSFRAPWRERVPLVVTVHDVAVLLGEVVDRGLGILDDVAVAGAPLDAQRSGRQRLGT